MRTPCVKLLQGEWPESITPHDVRQTCLTPAWHMRKLLCASCFAQVALCELQCVQVGARQHQARCSAQTGRRKLVCASCSTQVALSCSAQVAPRKLLQRVGPWKWLPARCSVRVAICASWRETAPGKVLCANWSVQVGLRKLLYASCTVQVALRKLLRASCSGKLVPASGSLQVALCKLRSLQVALCKLLCASCSVQVALRKLLCASCANCAPCKLLCASCSVQVALCKLLCVSCSAQVALGKALCANWSVQVGLRKLLSNASCVLRRPPADQGDQLGTSSTKMGPAGINLPKMKKIPFVCTEAKTKELPWRSLY